MARKIPDNRFARLVDSATSVFIKQGYKRTQMGDVAEALGVAKGTLYLYVESKEALFDLVVRCADSTDAISVPDSLPVRTPAAGAMLAFAQERLAEGGALPALAAALKRQEVLDARGELEEIAHELYRTLSTNRTAIKLLDAAGRDFPELADLWFQTGREGVLALLTEYFDDRIRTKTFSCRARRQRRGALGSRDNRLLGGSSSLGSTPAKCGRNRFGRNSRPFRSCRVRRGVNVR